MSDSLERRVDELTASRARIIAAADESRRRIERELHEGAQQRLMSLGLELREAEAMVPDEMDELKAKLGRAVDGLTGIHDELRDLSRNIHPATLSRGGLGSALKSVARRSPVPVELELRSVRRLPANVELGVYHVVSEALLNAARHANASVVRVEVDERDGWLEVSVRDDGVGGADRSRGSGLIGLEDRVAALGGRIDVDSPAGGGTALAVHIPI
jgi:signal transduction histidine kinase